MSRCRIHPTARRPSPDLLARFRKLPSTIVSDQLERYGAIQGVGRITGPELGILAGTALTVRTRPGDNLAIYKAIEIAEDGDVLVIDGGGFTDRALIGEIVYRFAVAKGIGGFIIDGAIRDVAEIAAGPVPVFAKGAVHLGPFKSGPCELRGAISIGGTVVRDGDIVVGDADGIAVVPAERIDEVVESAESDLAAEEQSLKRADAAELDVSFLDGLLEVEWVGDQPTT